MDGRLLTGGFVGVVLIPLALGSFALLRWVGDVHLFLTKSRWRAVKCSTADLIRKLFLPPAARRRRKQSVR